MIDDYLKTRAGERTVTTPPFAQVTLGEVMTGKGGLLFRSPTLEEFFGDDQQRKGDR